MTFRQYLLSIGFASTKTTEIVEMFWLFVDLQNPVTSYLVKQKDRDEAERLRAACATALPTLGTPEAKRARLQRLLDELNDLADGLALSLARRKAKADTERRGRVAMAAAAAAVDLPERINGDRVLHFTSAFTAIVQSKYLRISSTSDQGCIFCVPARYADQIAQQPPATVKQWFDIRGDLSHYVEFNLEDSRSFESFNSHIDTKLKGQKELKIHQEIRDLDRRDPVWYEWKGNSQGGWVVVPGPIRWGQ